MYRKIDLKYKIATPLVK